MDSKEPSPQPQPQPQFRNEHAEEFTVTYANNVAFEPTVWDLKIVFGELDTSAGVVQQHTAITVPWTIAKLALYYLAGQIAGHEVVSGRIHIPPSVIPVPPLPPPKEHKDEPAFQRAYEEFKRIHEDFMKDLQK